MASSGQGSKTDPSPVLSSSTAHACVNGLMFPLHNSRGIALLDKGHRPTSDLNAEKVKSGIIISLFRLFCTHVELRIVVLYFSA